MRIANGILEFLKKAGVDYIFGIPAGTISPLFDALNDVSIKPIVAKNEGGAAYMAARYASVSGKLAVCMGAGGVGANNMMNGVGDAFRAKAPVLFLTGYVHRWQIGKGAIQELNTEEILRPITKYSKTVLKEEDVMKELELAVKTALTVPMGPVFLSVPIDIQLASLPGEVPDFTATAYVSASDDNKSLEEACKVIEESGKGLILAGKGARGKSELVKEISKHLQWPVITTPEGKGVVSNDFPLNLGNYGFASTDAASAYVNDPSVDCLLILGTSLGENATNNFSKALTEGKKVIHIDWDIKELGKVYKTDVKLCADLEVALPYIIQNTKAAGQTGFERTAINNPVEKVNTGVSLKEFMEQLPEYMPKDTYYMADMGEFMNYAFKYLSIPEGGDFETNLNYAAMGSAIGGAVGVQAAYPGRSVAVFAGDGDFFMNGMEVLTAAEYELPIVYFIINNAMLGFVEHGHKFLFERVVNGFCQKRISIADMMAACGLKTMVISENSQIKELPEFLREAEGPVVVELITDGSEPAPNGDRLKALQKHN
ncbi:thiamine pyrophosphate-binding protein [Anaerocolumna sp. AGMB13020]|uniref:thiamine pyrophosphate-binding protein n=1 Tax=Anaerocolumna sp. AGMB13020 TaxID=3081750 RepID=UPI00295311CE|nr:thiamine pyrophosphate-binding protein [Anaerocolumna sp. AGMB13020]WOO38958.1 thiamine pyrophosphate-binding protein [Anaerocolumna sp. AGMB13020]